MQVEDCLLTMLRFEADVYLFENARCVLQKNKTMHIFVYVCDAKKNQGYAYVCIWKTEGQVKRFAELYGEGRAWCERKKPNRDRVLLIWKKTEGPTMNEGYKSFVMLTTMQYSSRNEALQALQAAQFPRLIGLGWVCVCMDG